LIALALGVACALTSVAARADAMTEARTTFELGVEASRAQKWDEARAQFQHSLSLLPKASTMFNLAVADIKLGLGREALEQLDAFEKAASPSEHAQMLERAQVLRPQAQALVDSEQATAEHGGNVLSKTDDGFTDAVRQQVQQAREDYARGRDREALTGFERAYKSSRRAELLYNIGVVADRLREDRRAARAYDQFVAALPDAPEAAVAQVRSDSLHATLAERERAGEEAARNNYVPQQEHDAGSSMRKSRTMLVVGTVLLVGGVTATAVSAGLMASKLDEYNKCLSDDMCNNPGSIKVQRGFMYTGAIVGGAAALTGLALTIAGGVRYGQAKRDRERAMSLLPSLAATPGSALLTWQGRF
jgi:tetratricopeptide (TPR) repeat protein